MTKTRIIVNLIIIKRFTIMKKNQEKKAGLLSVFTALFAALTAVSGFIAIPLPGTPVPIVLQNILPVLTGCLLGGVYGSLSTAVFLLAGGLGLPVFAGGKGGTAPFFGPTGGFLAGYFAAAALTGFLLGKPSLKKKTPLYRIIPACAAGFTVIYAAGIARFMQITGKSLYQSLLLACFPYLIGDVLKCVLVIFLAVKLRPVSARYLSADEKDDEP